MRATKECCGNRADPAWVFVAAAAAAVVAAVAAGQQQRRIFRLEASGRRRRLRRPQWGCTGQEIREEPGRAGGVVAAAAELLQGKWRLLQQQRLQCNWMKLPPRQLHEVGG